MSLSIGLVLWYTIGMDNMQVIDSNLPELPTLGKRVIADALRETGAKEIFYSPDNVRLTYATALSRMLWQASVDGTIYFSDGSTVSVTDEPKIWLEVIKFLATHLDGPAGAGANFNGINVFKVYRGIDPDRV